MVRKRPNNITAMHLMPMTGSGITTADMKSRKAKPTHTRLKQAMLSCVITWPDWQDHLAVSRVAPMHSNVPCACLCIASIADNSISNGSLPILHI